MQWDQAAAVAGEIAAAWTGEGGPGGAVLLFDADGIRAEACGGRASLEQTGDFTADTTVRYASISKHFLCALLAATGAIGFDDRLGADLELTPALAALPVGRALDMTAGIPDAMETLWLLGVPPTATIGQPALRRFVGGFAALNFPPGSEISYSNSGYRLVQSALAAKGIDYAQALAEQFLDPLGLAIRLPYDETDPVAGLSRGYWRGPLGWQHGRYGLHYSASGGLAGSARDLATWLRALLAGRGALAGVLARLTAPRPLVDGRMTDYGLGLAASPMPGMKVVGHGGSLPGFKNHFLLAPDLGVGVIVVSNREDTDAHGAALRVMAALGGVELAPPLTAALPDGLFVADRGPYWMEHAAGRVDYLGASDTLFPGADGIARSRSAHLPMRLRAEDGAIAGEIGHAPRRFLPVAPGLSAPPAWAGRWAAEAQDARFEIAVANGAAQFTIGTGPLRSTMRLTPLTADRALLEGDGDGPWRQRVCLQFDGDIVRLVTNRSRVLVFQRNRSHTGSAGVVGAEAVRS